MDLSLKQPAIASCEFEADGAGGQVRVAPVNREELDAWLAGRSHQEMAATPPSRRGRLRMAINDLDTYVAIDNAGPQAAKVRLHVFLEEPQVRYLSRRRQLAVIILSFGVFFAIVSFSARKLLKAIRK